MLKDSYYRGGSSLRPRLEEVRIDPLTQKLRTTRGVSVYDRPDHPNVKAHGGAHQLIGIPERLVIVQRGRDVSHHEILPATSMTFEEYESLLDQIVLIAV